jgi:tetratricopeptide (TPR) repeat protein
MTAVKKSPTAAIRNFFDGAGGGVLLVVLVVACYLLTTHFHFIWDDDAYVVDNPHLRDFAGLSRMWTHVGATPQYYPVTFTSFWIEYQIAGINPKVSHGVNMVLHACSALLLWTILRRLLVPGAWLAAAIFAVHPINVESVAWISERKNTLSLAFALSALYVYLRYAKLIVVETVARPLPAPGDEEVGEGVKLSLPDDPARLYMIFLALFVCALLSKTTASMLVPAIAVITWWKRGAITIVDLRPLILPLLLGFSAGMLTSWIEQNPYIIGARGPEWQHGDSWISDKIARLALAGQVSVFYIVRLLTPHTSPNLVDVSAVPNWLMPFTPWPMLFSYPKWKVDPAVPMQWLGSALVIGTVIALYLKRTRIGRGALACVLLYLIGIFPASGFFRVFPQRYSWVADHFAYVGAIAAIVGLTALGTILIRRLQMHRVGVVLGVAVIISLMIITIWHSRSFENLPKLWAYTLDRNPQSWWAKVNEGNHLIQAAKNLRPASTQPADLQKSARERLEHLRLGRDLIVEATEIYPDSYEAYYSLATLAANVGNLPQALRYVDRAEAAAARMGQVKFLLPKFLKADLLAKAGDRAGAQAIYRDLQRFEPLLSDQYGPALLDARMKLADLLKLELKGPVGPGLSEHDRKIAVDIHEQYLAASELMPHAPAPKLELARIYMEAGRAQDALTQIAMVFEDDPNNVDAKYAVALIALGEGDLTKANNQLLNIIKMYPKYIQAYVKIAEVLDLANMPSQALERVDQALALDPEYEPAKKLRAQLTGATTRPTTRPARSPATAATTP